MLTETVVAQKAATAISIVFLALKGYEGAGVLIEIDLRMGRTEVVEADVQVVVSGSGGATRVVIAELFQVAV